MYIIYIVGYIDLKDKFMITTTTTKKINVSME